MQTASLDPARIDAIVLDVIGTLVDEHATGERVAAEIVAAAHLPSAHDLRRRWADHVDERMAAVVAGEAEWAPHARVSAEAVTAAVAELGGAPTAGMAARAAAADREHRAWPDVAGATAALRRRRLVVALSNADLDALVRIANAERISWDAVLSAAAVRTHKPVPAAYRHAIAALDLDPTRTLFAACHPWDLRAAAAHGFRTAYVARPGADRPTAEDRFDVSVDDLAALASLLA